MVGIDELAEEERHVAVPRHGALGRQVEARERVGKAVLPAGERRVVVGLVGDVPAEDDVAEAEAAGRRWLGGAEELVDVQVLAAQDAVDVAHRDLDLGAAALANGGERGMLWGGSRHGAILRSSPNAAAGAPLPMPSSFRAPATAATASFISLGPIAPMQPTRNVSSCVSLPG